MSSELDQPTLTNLLERYHPTLSNQISTSTNPPTPGRQTNTSPRRQISTSTNPPTPVSQTSTVPINPPSPVRQTSNQSSTNPPTPGRQMSKINTAVQQNSISDDEQEALDLIEGKCF